MILNTILIIFFAILILLSLAEGGEFGMFVSIRSVIAIIVVYDSRYCI